MSTDVAIKLETIQSIRKMKEDDAGGGNVGGRNEFKKLKRKSDESIEVGGKKMKKKWNTIRRKKSNRGKKFQKKPRSPVENGGETPKSAESKKKVTTTTTTATAPSAGGKRKRRMTESFNAPFNSTQFLMNDHKTEAVRHLDSTLNGGRGEGQTEEVNVDDENSVDISMAERPQRRITRARESSFSIDSDEDYYYSSPEDEEEFMSREFMKDYDNLRNDRLIDMSKTELINEYLQMEERIETLEVRLSRQNSTSQTTTENVEVENDTKTEEEQKNTSDSNSKEAMADTISKFQKEIQRLESENDKLKLVQAVQIPTIPPGCSSSCSSCSESGSESDSDSDSDDSSESEDSEMEEEKETKQVFDTILREKSRQIGEVEGDTGYESGHSNKPVTKNASISTLNDEGIDPNDTTEDKPENNEIESEPESCPELISVNCITSTSP